jgi:cytoskeletal protein CcmA (bactofilin family)
VASNRREATNFKTNRRNKVPEAPGQGAARESKEGRMLQSSENSFNLKSNTPAPNPNPYNPVKNVTAPVDQATIGRTLVIKGEISGSEALYIDGRIEGKITMPESRVTIGRNGTVDASIQARELVVMGKVNGNIECSDRVDIRAEGSVNGDISTVAHQRGRRRRAQGRNPGPQRRQAESAQKPERGSRRHGRSRQRVVGRERLVEQNKGARSRVPFLFWRAF